MDKLVLEFKNGDDIHFNYSSQTNAPSNAVEPSLSSKKKKKKKKKKSGASSAAHPFTLGGATLNDPDADYPESRVIKFDADGNVVVESLDDDYGTEMADSHVQPRTIERMEPTKFSVFHFNNEDERNFWDMLPLQSKREVVDLSPYTVIQKIREQMKNRYNGHGGPEHSQNRFRDCPCCGRLSFHIEKEIEAAYHLDVQMIWNYVEDFKRDTFEDLKITPKYAMDKSFLRPRGASPPVLPVEPSIEVTTDELDVNFPAPTEDTAMNVEDTVGKVAQATQEAFSEDQKIATQEHDDDLDIDPATQEEKEAPIWSDSNEEDRDRVKDMFEKDLRMEAELRSRVKFVKGLKKELMERYKDPSKIPKSVLETLEFAEKTSSPAINYSMEILNSLGIITGDGSENKISGASDKINAFADLILNNDGRYFVDILESLIKEDDEKTAQIEEVEEDNPELEHYALRSPIEDAMRLQNKGYLATPLEPISNVHNLEVGSAGDSYLQDKDFEQYHNHDAGGHDGEHHKQRCEYEHDHDNDHEHHHNCNHHHDHERGDGVEDHVEEYASDYDDDYDYHHHCEHHENCDHDCHHECEHDEHYDDESEQESDGESEYSQQKRREEIRGFFLIQAVSMVRQNFREAYEKKVSEDRTQKFIEELEAEENAKREKEEKKLKQKEKQREKKRLQQLQKEEENRRKEAEELEKTIEIKRKRDELRAEQLRRKEELRLKKEEEKRKKIEALKRKELEQQKLAEQKMKQQEEQRKRNAEKDAERKEAEKREAEKAAKLRAAEDNKRVQEVAKATQDAKVELSSQEELVKEQPPGLSVSDDIKPQIAEPTPANNHLLDQLYQARPRSTSSTANFTQQVPSLSGALYSPTKQNIQQAAPTSWGTDAAMSVHGQPLSAQSNNVFSPFNETTTGADQWSGNQFSDPFLTSKPVLAGRASASGTSVWGGAYSSRNNSIWNSNPASAASGSTLWSSPVHQNAGLMAGSHQVAGNDGKDASLIQAATWDAFNTLHRSNQVPFGMAPAALLFQTTKALLQNTSLGMAEFLGSLRTGGRYQFDFVYDDLGSVTHIKVNSLNANTTPPLSMRVPLQQLLASQMQPPVSSHVQPQSHQSHPLHSHLLHNQQLHSQPLHSQPLQLLLPQHLPIQQSFQPQTQQLAPLHPLAQLFQGVGYSQTQFSENREVFGTNFQGQNSTSEDLNYDINLPGSVQGLLSQLGFAQTKGSIW